MIILLSAIGGMFFLDAGAIFKKDNPKNSDSPSTPVTPSFDVTLNGNLNLDMIKIVNSKEKDNWLISPYSMEIALNMLKEGATGETYDQINKVVPSRNITTFNVKDRISVANAVFVKNDKKYMINNEYINKLKSSYDADLINDDFKRPDKINSWVNKKTYEMIPSVLNEVPENFVLGLANAVAIDVEWAHKFDCFETTSHDFVSSSGTKKVEMMHDFSYYNYIYNDNEIGVVIPYKAYTSDGKVDYDENAGSTQLEFIAIMPKNKDINSYINDLTIEGIDSVLKSVKEPSSFSNRINLYLPRFEYDYDDEHFQSDLNDLGITDVFDYNLSSLDKMKNFNITDRLYVSKAIHKTHISLNETGTKAAAVTFFGMENSSAMIDESEIINIVLDHPFMYIIRDTKTHEMLFFGVTQNPKEWKGSTCKN